MSLSIKQKQILGVTSIVVLVVVVLSVLHLVTLSRVLLRQSYLRGEVITQAIFQRARTIVTSKETGYQELRTDPGIRSTLESAIFSENVTYAAIVDLSGIAVAHSDSARVGERLPEGSDLAEVVRGNGLEQLRTVYATFRMLEYRQPIELGDEPFAEIRVGIATPLVRRELDAWLRPAALTAAIALVIAILIAMGLSQLVLRPIHVIRSGLTRLGQGDLGATLDLQGDEFKDLGDIFASVSNQLKATMPDSIKRTQLLELSRRVTALGRLTAGVAHEVKNPLNAMMIHLELLKQKLESGATSESAGTHVDVIGREIRRLDDVVQGFLKFAKPEELTFQAIEAREITGDILKTLQPEAEAAGVSLVTNCSDDLPAMEGDPTILRQALLNLAKNAIQAMTSGGTLTISCTETKDGRIELRIADTGVGIPPENLAKIFDLYFTTKEHGTGIGLSLVYRTIQLHNGDIDVESTPGVGTTFIIKLPRAGASTPAKHSDQLTSLKGVAR